MHARFSNLLKAGLLGAACWAVAPGVLAADVRLEAPDEVRGLLKRHLSAFSDTANPDAEPAFGDVQAQQAAWGRRVRKEAQALLETEGYFAPRIELAEPEPGMVQILVDPGRRAVVRDVRIDFGGALAEDTPEAAQRREALRTAWALPAGTAFSQSRWADGKAALLAAVQSRDFAAARLVTTQADVDPERAQVRLRVEVDSGPRFVIGSLGVRGLSVYTRDLVERYLPVLPGEPYDYDRLVAAQNALQTTPYFSGALLDIDRTPETAAAAPLSITLTEAPPRRLGAAVGYSTDTGARVEFNYRNANALGRALDLNTTARIEQRRQSAFADVYLPQRRSGLRDSVGFGVLAEDIENLQTERVALGGVISRSLRDTTVRGTINLQYERTRPVDGAWQSSRALTFVYGADIRRIDDLVNPERGWMAGFQIGGGAKALGSDQNFLRLYGRTQYYRPLGAHGMVILRGDLGYTIAPSRDGIPQDFLFRTGGDQSVRGYTYKSLGVPDQGAVVGGRTLAVASMEYVRWVGSMWGLAAFADVGDAADTWQSMRAHSGYGIGGRVRSPAGPLGVDVAYGHQGRRVRLHLSIAFAF